MFDPLADERPYGLMRFLFQCGNEISDIETALAPGIEQVLNTFLKSVGSDTIAKSIEKKKAFGAHDGCIVFRL